jgi:hypothetical protein
VIQSIEAEISFEEMPKFMKWADSKLDNAYTKVLDRFYSAVLAVNKTKDRSLIEKELKLYQDSMIRLISKYRSENKISSTYAFLESIANQAGMNISDLNIKKSFKVSDDHVYETSLDLSPCTQFLQSKLEIKELV